MEKMEKMEKKWRKGSFGKLFTFQKLTQAICQYRDETA